MDRRFREVKFPKLYLLCKINCPSQVQGFNNNDEIGYRRLCSMHPMASDAIMWLNEHGMYL